MGGRRAAQLAHIESATLPSQDDLFIVLLVVVVVLLALLLFGSDYFRHLVMIVIGDELLRLAATH